MKGSQNQSRRICRCVNERLIRHIVYHETVRCGALTNPHVAFKILPDRNHHVRHERYRGKHHELSVKPHVVGDHNLLLPARSPLYLPPYLSFQPSA
jgi:hypothetical protein